jgi:hypothetical protein
MKPELSIVPGALPEPPYPADTKANGFRQEVDLTRAMTSRTWRLADAECRPWLWQLWLLSWGNIPVGTWEPDDAVIAAAIGCKPEWFVGHREQLMRGWTRHSDGLLYHPFITEQVLEMLGRRRGTAERMRKHRASHGTDTGHVSECQSRVSDASRVVTYAKDQDQDHEKKTLATQESPVAVANGTPYEAIRELWIEVLPSLTRPMPVAYWTDARRQQIRSRWKDQLPTLESWRKCFEKIRTSPFLMGKTGGRDGRPFKCDLFWITKPDNLLKLYEGRYHA